MPVPLGDQLAHDLEIAESYETRCVFTFGQEQCKYKRSEGSIYCPKHTKKKKSFAYDAALWAPRINDISTGKMKDLTQEIALCRMVLERYLNVCETDADLLQYNGAISAMVDRVGKLVDTSMKVEKHLEEYFTQDQLVAFVEDMLMIIARHAPENTAAIAESIREHELFKE
jgi:hypothetical protein